MTGVEPGSRSALLAAQLRGLVRAAHGDAAVAGSEAADFAGGAALLSARRAWILVDADPVAALGPALVWAGRRDVESLDLLVMSDEGVVARRAALFRAPPTVWRVDGTELRVAEPAPPPELRPARSAPQLAELLVDADLEVVVEDGIVRGEVLGLEVARIVHGTTSSGVPIDEPVLEVGVGQADRELTAMLHGSLPPVEQLARVAEIVRRQRRAGAERHPLNQLAPERWLRARCVADPGRIGLESLRPAAPAVPRPNLRDPAVAMAVGVDAGGSEVVVAFSVGVLLDLVPAAADARELLAPGAPLRLVLPERDAHDVTRALAARLLRPAELIAVAGDWRA